MKLHLAIRQCADWLAVLADVRDQQDGGVAAIATGKDPAKCAEAFTEPDLVLFRELLVPQQDDRVIVPSLPQRGHGRRIKRAAQIDAFDLGADRRGELADGETRRSGDRRPRRQCVAARLHDGSPSLLARLGCVRSDPKEFWSPAAPPRPWPGI